MDFLTIGFSLNKKEKLFNLFVQLDSSNTRKFGELGIGLVRVYNFVKLMGGMVEVESAVDEGSRFDVRIPLVRFTREG